MGGRSGDQRYAGLTRVTSPTGGQKEQRDARFDLIPWGALWHVAEVYAHGAAKYDDHNWRKGYPVSLNTAAMARHLAAIMEGEDTDPESGMLHAGHIAWHALCLIERVLSGTLPDVDDRFAGPRAWPPGGAER